jgi:hypothetical protein
MIFWERKSQNQFFSTFSNLNDDCSKLSFDVYNVCVAQKLQISEFLMELFFAWTLATSATSWDRNFNLSNLNRVSNFSWISQLSYEILIVALEWNTDNIVEGIVNVSYIFLVEVIRISCRFKLVTGVAQRSKNLSGQVEMRRTAARYPAAPSILPKSGWACAHPVYPLPPHSVLE